MRGIHVVPAARQDIARLLRDSEARFGIKAADRYQALLEEAFNLLRRNPTPPSAGPRGFAPSRLTFFHLRHVRATVRIGRPRHFIVYEFDETNVRVVRVLHDAMDLRSLFG